MKLHILYGTESGTAEFLSDSLQSNLPQHVECKVDSLDDVDPTSLEGEVLYILITATFGSGELPATSRWFFDRLQDVQPDLSHIRFAIFGLGDKSFGETYNNGSRILMTEMLERGATMIGDRGLHDASSEVFPQDVALPWLLHILD